MSRELEDLLAEVRACRVCAAALPHAPRPVLRAQASARVLIIGQAPGNLVHQTGVPWNDPSGDRLRDWLAVDRDVFYDAQRIAIVPMGFCYPGTEKGADLPPRPECAPLWHERLLTQLPAVELTLLIGGYAQARYLGRRRGKSLTETVCSWRDHLADGYLALPHPSWRNTAWLKKNPWFEAEVVPELRRRVARLV